MKATDVKDWKSLNDFVYGQVSGSDNSPLSENDVEFLTKKSKEIFSNLKLEEIRDDVNTITEINVLDKKTNFTLFELIPEIWKVYYGVSLEICA